MGTTRRDFLRGLLVSTAAIPVLSVVPDWREAVRAGMKAFDAMEFEFKDAAPPAFWRINWNEVTDAVSYTVYRNEDVYL